MTSRLRGTGREVRRQPGHRERCHRALRWGREGVPVLPQRGAWSHTRAHAVMPPVRRPDLTAPADPAARLADAFRPCPNGVRLGDGQ